MRTNNKKWQVYILKLVDNKYYIGRTTNIIKKYPNYENVPTHKLGNRIKQHFNKRGSVWTRIHKPVSVINIYHDCITEDEDKYVKLLMKNHGIENVRGGNYSKVKLDSVTIDFLQNEIIGNSDRCYKCGKDDHFIDKCTETKYKIESFNQKDVCNKCGQNIK